VIHQAGKKGINQKTILKIEKNKGKREKKLTNKINGGIMVVAQSF
jgi:hypothetical protein